MKHFEILSLGQLRESAKAEPISYVVDGLLPVGSLNMLAGKPKSGKSTLARQLAVAVTKGASFLDRAVNQGQVLYFAIEELKPHLAEHFDLLGAEDGTLHTVVGRPPKGTVTRLEATLEAMPHVRLVIIDPMFKFIETPDADKYIEVGDALAELAAIADKHKVAILCVHHSKKRATEEVGDSSLGSIAIAGGMFTTLFLKGEMQGTRTIQSSQRYGTLIEPTELDFDPSTRSFSLGEPLSAIEVKQHVNKQQQRVKDIVTLVASRPEGIEMDEIQMLAGGNTKALGIMLRELVESGSICREGTGKRGSPFVFLPCAIPMEKAA